MRRLGSSLKIRKKKTAPNANAVISMLNRHSQSRAKLLLTTLALRACQVAKAPLRTSTAPVQSTMPRASSLAVGQERCSSVSNTSLSAARRPPNSRVAARRRCGAPLASRTAPTGRPSRAGLALPLDVISVAPGAGRLAAPSRQGRRGLALRARLRTAPAAFRVAEAAFEPLARRELVLVRVLCRFEQLAPFASLLRGQVAQPPQLSRHLAAGSVARLGREQEPQRGSMAGP